MVCCVRSKKSMKVRASNPKSPIPYLPGKDVGCTNVPQERGNLMKYLTLWF